jgi:hypothetical protein
MHQDSFLFVQAIRTKYWLGMLAAVESALTASLRAPPIHKHPDPLQPGNSAEFRRFLVGARSWLLSEGRAVPDDLPRDQFMLLKPLCEHLVATGRFPNECLRLFDENSLHAQRPPAEEFPERKDRP